MSWSTTPICPGAGTPLDCGIVYDSATQTIIGTEQQFIALNSKYPGQTEHLQGSIQAIRCYLNNYGTPKQKSWGEKRLRYIVRHALRITVPVKFRLV